MSDKMKDFKGSHVLVIGMARTGLAVARTIAQKGARVTLADARKEPEHARVLEELRPLGVRVVSGGYPQEKFDLVVPSPGVSPQITPIAMARQMGVPVWSEVELAFRLCRVPVLAITGTNGKTTTTTLAGEMFRNAGWPVAVAGNIGIPFIQEVEKIAPDGLLVLEVSSFQLELTETFHPRVAALLNLTPDHLDRHGTWEAYIAAKARIFQRQNSQDATVLNYDDPVVRELAMQVPGRVVFFSRLHSLANGVVLNEGCITVVQDGYFTKIMDASKLLIPGDHNLENAMAAVAAGWDMGLSPESMASTLATFPGVPHRLERVSRIAGVDFINDSKGTNPDATLVALRAFFDRGIVLIAGGRNKGSSFEVLAQSIKERVKHLILLGEAADEIAQAVLEKGFSSFSRVGDLGSAVRRSLEVSRPGDVVLLSPACASWDMFKNYEERGDVFKGEVAKNGGIG